MNRKTQTLVLLSTVVLAFGVVATVALWYFQQNKTILYKNKQKGFSIRYPQSWEASDTTRGDHVIFRAPQDGVDDKFQENVNIVVQDISQKPMTTLEGYTQLAVEQMHAIFKDTLAVQVSEEVSLGGRPGYKFGYVVNRGDNEMHFLHYWTVVGLNAYQVTYTAWDNVSYGRYLQQVEKMARTFRVQ